MKQKRRTHGTITRASFVVVTLVLRLLIGVVSGAVVSYLFAAVIGWIILQIYYPGISETDIWGPMIMFFMVAIPWTLFWTVVTGIYWTIKGKPTVLRVTEIIENIPEQVSRLKSTISAYLSVVFKTIRDIAGVEDIEAE